ncbi:hypothetical protein RND81_05G211300 [Saponaria officinalis]|uniref:Bet v I/Major latex protein domain-containing protein n=1 Tax=Saponaria officinalis TaxID=3572 RepID=A0AAW1L0Q9_SAPOF
MGVSTHTMADYTSSVAPARLFQGYCINTHNFLPKAMPGFIKSVDLVQGDSSSAGSIKRLNFPEGRPFKYAKNRVYEIDAGKFYCKYTTIEGGVVGDNIEKAVYETKFEPTSDGCPYTMVVHFHSKGEFVVTEEDVAAAKQNIKNMFNEAEEYLNANPQLYA